MKFHFSLAYLLVLIFSAGAFAKYVAVLETTADPGARDLVSSSDRRYMTDVLRGEAVKVLPAQQNYTIMTRENINVMLPPGKSIEDCEGSCLAETGKNIAADYVAQARVGSFGGSLTLSVEMYETAGNKLVATFNGDGEDVKALLEIIKRDAPKFFKSIKDGNSVLGGIAGFATGVDFAYQGAQKFIVEIVSNPEGAIPTVDGKAVAKCTSTPCKVELDAGEHRIVAVKEFYEDAELLVNVQQNGQQISLTLAPNWGYVDLQPRLLSGVGDAKDLSVNIDGRAGKLGKTSLGIGVHDVVISHPCYDPVIFKVGIEKDKTEMFDGELVRGVGGLELSVERQGEPQVLPVYVDGNEIGHTPFNDKVPLCSDIQVDVAGTRERVNVPLKWHDVVKYTHSLTPVVVPAKTETDSVRERASAGYAALDGKEPQKSVPANVENQGSGIHWVPVGISAAVLVGGTVLAIVGNSMAKSESEKDYATKAEYESSKDKIKSAQTLRTVGIGVAIAGGICLGLSFAF